MVLDSRLNDQISNQTNESLVKESVEVSRDKLQRCSKSVNGNSSDIHSIQTFEDENIDENIYEYVDCICICIQVDYWTTDGILMTPSMPKTLIVSFKGIASGRLSKE
ncbi:hypothetical protein V6N13_130586 [Hibiscus sabdariffa]